MTEKKEEIIGQNTPTKEELFKSEPDNFFHINDIELALIANESGAKRVVSKQMTPSDMGGALFILQHHCSKMFYAVEAHAEKNRGLVKSMQDLHSKKNFRNFIKGK